MAIALLYVPCKDEAQAQLIGRALVEQHLVACANWLPAKSCYWWQDACKEETEVLLLLKTGVHLWEKVRKAIEKLHSYEVPCIVKFEVEVNEAYEDWVHQMLRLSVK